MSVKIRLITISLVALSAAMTGFAVEKISLMANPVNQVKVFPNPWRADRHPTTQVTFDAVPSNATVKIFTTSGRFVKNIPISGNQAQWDLTNDSGDKVASGIYMYLILANSDKKTGQLAVIR